MNTIKRFFLCYFLSIAVLACKRDYDNSTNDDQQEINNPIISKDRNSPDLNGVNFYLENSLSMNGYANGNTDFKKAIITLLSEIALNIAEDSIQVNVVNTKIHPLKKSYLKFNEDLTLRGIPTDGNKNNSDINAIFRDILESNDANQVSILVTDAIYSISKTKKEDLVGSLFEKSKATRNYFVNELRDSNLSSLVLKMSSFFDGNYYPAKGGQTQIEQTRPYYIFFFGDSELITNLSNSIGFDKLPGYSNDFFVLKNKNLKIDYTILEYGSGKIGDFENDKIREYPITSVKYKGKSDSGSNYNEFGFAVAVDLSHVPLPESYLLKENKYKSTSDFYKIYKVLKIENNEIDDKTQSLIHDMEMKMTSNYTHVLFIKSSDKVIEQNIKFSLINEIPAWVGETGNNDDSQIKNDTLTTFGFDKLSSGIIEAYNYINQSEEYINFTISVKS